MSWRHAVVATQLAVRGEPRRVAVIARVRPDQGTRREGCHSIGARLSDADGVRDEPAPHSPPLGRMERQVADDLGVEGADVDGD